MKIKTVWIKADEAEEFDKTVNKLIANGWELRYRTLSPTRHAGVSSMLYAELEMPDEQTKDPAPDPEEEHRRILLEPDVAYLVEIKRGMSTRDDYVNTALELGMLVMDKCSGKIDAAINGLFDLSEPDEEETADE